MTSSQCAFVILPLTPADAPEVSRIIDSVHLLAEVPIGPRWSSQQVDEECRGLGWILRDSSNRLAAFVLLRDAVSAWEITFLATAVEVQRCGHMRKLLAHLVAILPKGQALWLEVHEDNVAAQHLYEVVGFQKVGHRPSYYSDGGAAILYNYE